MAVVLASPGPRLGLASGTDEATPPPPLRLSQPGGEERLKGLQFPELCRGHPVPRVQTQREVLLTAPKPAAESHAAHSTSPCPSGPP